jgi:hypothetical protein
MFIAALLTGDPRRPPTRFIKHVGEVKQIDALGLFPENLRDERCGVCVFPASAVTRRTGGFITLSTAHCRR